MRPAWFLRALAGLLLAAAPGAAFGQDEAAAPVAATPVVIDAEGVAIGGYDPVAYVSFGRPMLGSPAHEYRWMGATWRFASAAARDRFAVDPEGYAPRFGGWCAWAMSQDRLARGDPLIWSLIQGRLYFNCNREAERRWIDDLFPSIARAEENWARRFAAAVDAAGD